MPKIAINKLKPFFYRILINVETNLLILKSFTSKNIIFLNILRDRVSSLSYSNPLDFLEVPGMLIGIILQTKQLG